MGILISASIRMVYRNRQAVFWALAFPIIFVVVFGLFNFEQVPDIRTAIVTEQPSTLSETLVSGLKEAGPFTISHRTVLALAKSRLEKDKLDLVIFIPAVASATVPSATVPGKTTQIQVFYKQGNVQTNQISLGLVRQVIDGMNLRMIGVASLPLAMQTTSVSARSVQYYDWLLPGLVAMGVMQYSLTGIAIAMATHRERGVLKQMLTTPLSPIRFLVAQVFAYLLLTMVQTALILAVGISLFHGHVYGSMVWMLLISLVGNLVFLMLGLAVAGRAPNSQAAQGIGMVVAMPMMFLSGVFFPTDTLPKVLEVLFRYLPLSPLIIALRKVANDGLPISAVGSQLGLLGIWVVVAFVVASMNFSFKRA